MTQPLTAGAASTFTTFSPSAAGVAAAEPAPPTQLMQSRDFWAELCPELSLETGFTTPFALNELTQTAGERASARLMTEGYFQEIDPRLVDIAGKLSRAITTFVERGIPPVFIFLYDEPWIAFHRQHATIGAFLGGDYRILPDFWAWHVDPRKGQAGWRPHRDKGFQALAPDGSPLSLTIWMPLSDAHPLNGCMYMLPANKDPVYGTPDDKTWKIDYPSIRALPGVPGDWFCWNQAVLHWGGQSSSFAEAPRMSMALEFQRSDIAPYNEPLMPALMVLSFEDRLRLTAKQILQYAHMYPLSPEMNDLARRILSPA